MTKSIFERTKLNNKSIERVRYATSTMYMTSVKVTESKRNERLGRVKLASKSALLQKISSL